LNLFCNQTFLITGATGTFGQAFVRKVLTLNPRKVICFSDGENNQVEMQREFKDDRLRFMLGNVRDRKRLEMAMGGVDIVVHAAALKHVDKCEYDPHEAVETNINGTINVVSAAINTGVYKVLLISTDKAVNPANIYGACKLVGDFYGTLASKYSSLTKIATIRFGNFFRSRGAFVDYVLDLKRKRKPVPITDSRMTRFFISVESAVDRALDAITDMEGGEIYFPKMRSFRITQLADKLYPGCEMEFVGIRKGEKIHEELFTEEQAARVFDKGKLFVIHPSDAAVPRQTSDMPVFTSADSRWLVRI